MTKRARDAFPEFVTAARSAAEHGLGYARDWKDDESYMTTLREL